MTTLKEISGKSLAEYVKEWAEGNHENTLPFCLKQKENKSNNKNNFVDVLKKIFSWIVR